MSFIIDVHAREVIDSRGNPTVEVEALLLKVVHLMLLFRQGHQQVLVKY